MTVASKTNYPCPMCRENGHDKTGDHLFLAEDGKNFICVKFHLHQPPGEMCVVKADKDSGEPLFDTPPEPAPSGDFWMNSVQEPTSNHIDVSDLPCVQYRGIPQKSYKKYGCHMELSETDLSVVKVYYPLYVGDDQVWKIRKVQPEKDFAVSEKLNGRKMKFMGQNLYKGQKTVLITEGQDDAIAADFMINDGTNKIGMQVLCISVPSGDNVQAFKDNDKFLQKFDKIIFCPDKDEAGKKLVDKLAALRSDVYYMDITDKDANDALVNGKRVEFITAFQKASKYRPPAIEVIESEDIESLRTPVALGLTYPWKSMTDLTYGMVPHSIVSIGSGPGAGKTSVVRAIQQHLMDEHKERIGIIDLESQKQESLRYLVGYIMNKKIHLPGAVYDADKAVSVAMSLKDKAMFFNSDRYTGHWSELEMNIRYMYSEGIVHFFIDPVSALVAHLDASAGNTYLNNMMIQIKNLKNELPIWIMMVNHLNNPTSGKSHDEGGRVSPSQFVGSKGQWRYSTEMGGCERNILSEDMKEKNTLIWRQLKHRSDGSKQGQIIRLNYNHDTGRLEEPPPFNPVISVKPQEDKLSNILGV